MTLTPSRQIGPRTIELSNSKYEEIDKEYTRLGKMSKDDLKYKASLNSKVELGWDRHVDKTSMINHIIGNYYTLSQLVEYWRLKDIEKKAIKAAKRKARRQKK